MSHDDVFYFAYGSNLNLSRMEKRTGTCPEGRVARLPGYRLAFNKRAAAGDGKVYANVIPQQGSEVWGMAYRCQPEMLNQLDRYEGVAGGHYRRETVQVVAEDGTLIQAVTYVAGSQYLGPEGSPPDWYLEHILQGARYHQIPEEYIQTILQLATVGEPPQRPNPMAPSTQS